MKRAVVLVLEQDPSAMFKVRWGFARRAICGDDRRTAPNVRFLLCAALAAACCVFTTPQVDAEFDNPDVQRLVDRGIKHIEDNYQQSTRYGFAGVQAGGYGEHALIGYAHMKVKHNPNHPVVQQGIASAKTLLTKLGEEDPGGDISKTVYTVSVAAMLFAEVDKNQYRSELEKIANFLKRIQYPSGGYGYYHEKTGDVSQTQYAMLALWTMDHSGVRIDYDTVPRTLAWLMRVQDVEGGWPYQGEEPRVPGTRIRQQGVTASMAVAGGSALLIGADILRVWGDALSGNDPKIPGLPKAVKLYIPDDELGNRNVRRPSVSGAPLLSAIENCQSYLSSNSPDPGKLRSQWPYYQLYSLERYESFREVALGKKPDPSPPWFLSGVEYLKSTERPDGGWTSYVTSSVETSFAVLFLIRSTQKAIALSSSGSLAGSRDLPKDTTQITVDGTQIKGKPVAAEVNSMLALLESDGADQIEGKSIPENLKLATDPKQRAAQIDRMERLVRGSQSWQARRVAARLLGQSDDPRVVPTLIFALTDPDPMVPRYARDGLRFISRRFEGFGMPDEATPADVTEAQRQWRAWYRRMDPGYVFLDYDL
ncbi:prenyltransferase/squalene oxidase repeat-containing protein [Novipirellula artificiosorum]|uniref:prenyltransferase/squalene oxidase repeat-containing protein n=1 Tax=Novipirellula artificiosorum TaxID=2528016 RepID=UPI001E57932A|nr:prenyltransferase/squalene oxidase repeat-containing protein [Novipirellula artificiosorum]